VFYGLEGDHDIDGSVGQRNPFCAPCTGVQTISPAGVRASSLGNVYPDHMGRTCLPKGCSAVPFSAGDVQDLLVLHEAARKGVTIYVLPEREAVRNLGNHPLACILDRE
jgi:hypothetical protein